MRHLIFHLTPLNTPAAQRCWRWHLRQINHYAHVFDGKLIFAINTGAEFTSVDEIVPLLPARSDVIPVPNHVELREVFTFPLLLAKVFTLSPQDQVFMRMAKGSAGLVTSMRTPRGGGRWQCTGFC